MGASGAATDQRGESGWQRFAAGDQLPHTDRHQSGGEPKRFIRSEKSRWHGRPRREPSQVLSTVATTSIEDAIAARGATVWFQLYHHPTNWAITKQMVQRAERAGSAAVVFTVDLLGGSNRETMLRQLDKRVCSGCHIGGQPIQHAERHHRRPAAQAESERVSTGRPDSGGGHPVVGIRRRLKAATSMKVFLKGIVTREDAELAVEHGVDGLLLLQPWRTAEVRCGRRFRRCRKWCRVPPAAFR